MSNKKATMIKSEIEEILQYVWVQATLNDIDGMGSRRELAGSVIPKARRKLRVLIAKSNQELLDRIEREVVGKYEILPKQTVKGIGVNVPIEPHLRNELRIEQQATIDRIRGEL